MELGKPPFEIEQQPGGTRVSVARLTHGAWIQEPASVQLDAEAVGRQPADDLFAVARERERDVAVSDEHEGSSSELERRAGGFLREHVLPDRVAGAGMEEVNAVQLRRR